MAFWGLFKKQLPARVNHNFNDDDREFSEEIRRQKRELKRLEFERSRLEAKAELDDLKAEIDAYKQTEEDNEDSSPTDKLLMLLAAKMLGGQADLSGKQTATTVSPNTQTVQPDKISLSDEGITALLKTMPSLVKKQLRNLPDEDLFKLANKQYPQYDEETIRRAVLMLKS